LCFGSARTGDIAPVQMFRALKKAGRKEAKN
jgi:hypothetical protein